MKKLLALLLFLTIAFIFSLQAQATLIVRGVDDMGNQLIYDTDFDITWYDFTNAADTWHNQEAWASSLVVNFGGNALGGWRLPTAYNRDGTGPCVGYFCTDCEYGHLYYDELGNPIGGPLNTSFIDGVTSSVESFANLLAEEYWTGTVTTAPDHMYIFAFGDAPPPNAPTPSGFQGDFYFELNNYYAIAVRDGDVSAVPEPGTIMLVGSLLLGFCIFRKKTGK